MSGTKESCTCEWCQRACTRRPGWFLPGEVEKLADNMDLMVQELFEKHLMLDYWYNYDSGDIEILSPAIVGYEGERAPAWPQGRCTFFKDGRCMIHDLGKPFECRETIHPEALDEAGKERMDRLHEWVAKQWRDETITVTTGEDWCG